jgi:hypothetical protein
MNSTIRRIILALAVVLVLAGASSAYADTILNYQVAGPGPNGTFTADFTLAMHPTPSGGNALVFWFSNLPMDVNGTWTNATVAFTSLLSGGVAGANTFALVGSQLFSWPSSSSTPIMNTGAFTLSGLTASGWGSYRVTVTAPESGSLVLLLVGLLVLFGGRRLRWLA